jgi:glutathione synthase/RimK-type ligase-like ATP-grasp enzyme
VNVMVWGVPSESPVELLLGALSRRSADVLLVHPRRFLARSVEVGISGGGLHGSIRVEDRTTDVGDISGVYVRPIEPELVPELRGVAADDPAMRRARAEFDALMAFTEAAPDALGCRVASRLSAMASNMSKPYQAQLVQQGGFDTPETVVTDDPDEARAFVRAHHGAIYKSVSGVRSIVSVVDLDRDAERLERIRWCPVQFQENVRGRDVRVHVVGDEVYAAIVDSSATDYRYARAQVGEDATLAPYTLPDDVAERCVRLARDLDLPFAGVDLSLADDGRVVCFEVNPSPGYSWYETAAGLPIADALARWLMRVT